MEGPSNALWLGIACEDLGAERRSWKRPAGQGGGPGAELTLPPSLAVYSTAAPFKFPSRHPSAQRNPPFHHPPRPSRRRVHLLRRALFNSPLLLGGVQGMEAASAAGALPSPQARATQPGVQLLGRDGKQEGVATQVARANRQDAAAWRTGGRWSRYGSVREL